MEIKEFVAEGAFRVDVFLSEKSGLTRSAVKKLSDEGKVLLGGKPAKAGDTVKAGQTVSLEIPDPEPIKAEPEDLPIEIVYEDEDLAVVNKAQGMTVHAGAGVRSGTLVNALLYRLKDLSGINGELRPGIVHRIDKDTSGLLVVAKNDGAHLSLSAQIQNKTCRREYLALLEGVVKQQTGRICTQIGRDPKDRLRMAVLPAGEGRYAETEYFAEERFAKNTLVRFSLKTGRTHQIRVHAKYMGHPVVGDKLYGYKNQRFALQGQLLHAFRMELTHPTTGERMTFTAPLPAYFERVLEIVRKD